MKCNFPDIRAGLAFLVLAVTMIPLSAQTSPFTTGQSLALVLEQLTQRGAQEGFLLQEKTSDRIIATYSDGTNFRAKATCDFDNGLANKVLVEWTGTTLDYRQIMLQWFIKEVERLEAEGLYQRDPLTEERLIASFPEKRGRAAVFVADDFSKRLVFLFYASTNGAFFSHMEHQYFFP